MKNGLRDLLFHARYLSVVNSSCDDQLDRLVELYKGRFEIFPCRLEEPFFAIVIRNNFQTVVEAKVYKYECDIAGLRVYICETKCPKERWNMSGKDFDEWERYATKEAAEAALEIN